MKLWKVRIKTYDFGIRYYELFVLSDSENTMLKTVKQYLIAKKDEEDKVDDYKQIDLNDETNRVL